MFRKTSHNSRERVAFAHAEAMVLFMKLIEKLKNRRRGSLLENTLMLYILQFSNMFLALLTQGYQVRVLGMDLVGTLGAAQYTVNFFQILIDFGFIMSATAKISQNREDKPYLNRILTCVVAAKVFFMLLSFGILLLFILPHLENPMELSVYTMYLFSTCMVSLLPDFMYRGLEQMAAVTVRAVSIKLFATIMIFFFVHVPGDVWMVPFFAALGNGGAVLFVYWHLYTKVGVKFCKVRFRDIWTEVKESSQFFLSKAAGSINTNLNGVLLKQIAGPVATGLYTNADKVIGAAKNGMSPIADSLYPHMMKHKNFSIVKKAMLFIYPVILTGCAVVFIFARPLLTLWLGEAGADVVLPLRLLMPVAVCCFPNYILGYPTLGAMGLAKFANISVGFGTVIYLLGALVSHFTVGINLFSLCVLTSLTEFSILAFRLVVIVKNRRLLQNDGGTR